MMRLPPVGILDNEVFRSVSFRADSVTSTSQAATTIAEESFRPNKPTVKSSIAQMVNGILEDESQYINPSPVGNN